MDDLSALSTDELRTRILQERATRAQLNATLENSKREVEEAKERQRLRRELEAEIRASSAVRGYDDHFQRYRARIDSDESGPHKPEGDNEIDFYHETPPAKSMKPSTETIVKSTIAYDATVHEREFIWEVSGLSWLPYTLKHESRECTDSEFFQVDDGDDESLFILVFSPHGGSVVSNPAAEHGAFSQIEEGTRATLALVRKAAHYGANLDVTFYVRAASGEFTQWGEATRLAFEAVSLNEPARCCVIGPDLEAEAKGVFSLPFDELLTSQWVKDDKITFKVVVKETVMNQHPDRAVVRAGDVEYNTETITTPMVEVPPPSLSEDLLELLKDGRQSDLTLEAAYGEAEPVRFQVHALLLSLRSPVFRAALTHEMSESASRTVTVRDVPPLALQALLHFLYTDDFAQVQKVLKDGAQAEAAAIAAAAASSSASASSGTAAASSSAEPPPKPSAYATAAAADAQRMAQLQAVLAAAHKYQVTRLLRWSEQQLCEHISADTVCSLLGLAHVYESPELEHNCLKFMQANAAAVVQRQEFAGLAPEALVKYNMFCAGIEPAEAAGRKRKRGD